MKNMYNDRNPKTAQGMKKVPLHLVPPVAVAMEAQALFYGGYLAARADGGRGYEPYNWRDDEISVSTYVSACKRHIDAFWDGENLDPDSGFHHIGHARACLGIMLDAMMIGKCIDDRPKTHGAFSKVCAEHKKHMSEMLDGAPRQHVKRNHPEGRGFGETYEGRIVQNDY